MNSKIRNKLIGSVLIHLAAILVFITVYISPIAMNYIKNMEMGSWGTTTPLGGILIVLPAIIITFFCFPETRTSPIDGSVKKKVGISLFLISQVLISLVYIFIIDYILR